MANSLTPTDVYAVVNAMAAEMFGSANSLTAFNTSSFVTVGEHMLRTGYTNTLDALSVVIGRTIVAARPYRGRFRIVVAIPEEWGGITRKISYYATKEEETTSFNTNVNTLNPPLTDGNSVDQWVITKQYPLEMNFCGLKVEQKTYTTFVDQLKMAFTSEAAFAEFMSGRLVAIANDLEVAWEARNRLLILNAVGATYNVGASRSVVNMTTEFNTHYSTNYTTSDLLTTYLKEFVAFFVAKLEGDLELARDYNELFHIYPARNDDGGNALVLPRHTPPAMRRLLLFMPVLRLEEKTIFPALFNTSTLRIEDYEAVEYWQNPNVPAGVDIVPNQLNTANGQSANGNRVQLSTVLGLMFDRDALATSVKIEDVYTTPINAKGKYFNTVYHWAFQHKLDQTENMILYYMDDSDVQEEPADGGEG